MTRCGKKKKVIKCGYVIWWNIDMGLRIRTTHRGTLYQYSVTVAESYCDDIAGDLDADMLTLKGLGQPGGLSTLE